MRSIPNTLNMDPGGLQLSLDKKALRLTGRLFNGICEKWEFPEPLMCISVI